ncbi:MAG: GNAT family N-acetyltransferase [Defluviitaleaceae bacterium]|nr:GNAT family N-acetyltransferase [Defluviitaleaceae bacterium]
MKGFTIRSVRQDEISKVAEFIARRYFDDIFFHWVVPEPSDRIPTVKAYYIEYISAAGSVCHVAETADGELVGATVWLPDDLDPAVSERIYKAVGKYAPNYKEISRKSYDSCPPMSPFYELVAVVAHADMQGQGIGGALLKHHLDILDEKGIATYLEASTPYHGEGVYAKFGYQQCGELMHFSDTAILYPLWRPARKPFEIVEFGGHEWLILDKIDDEVLIISREILEKGQFHHTFEPVDWIASDLRKYLNDAFRAKFSQKERGQILEEIFLLSIDEVVQYFGDSGQYKVRKNPFFIDDIYNGNRKATLPDGSPSRWLLIDRGRHPDLVACVTVDGKILTTGDFVNRESTDLFNVGIRPVMWISMKI